MNELSLIVIATFVSGAVLSSNPLPTRNGGRNDTIYFKLPPKFDTVSVQYRLPNSTCVVLDKRDLPGFKGSGAISFIFKRFEDMKVDSNSLAAVVKAHIITIPQLSDSLLLLKRSFFKRHTFFIIITRNNTCYIYKAKADYMYKDFSGESKGN